MSAVSSLPLLPVVASFVFGVVATGALLFFWERRRRHREWQRLIERVTAAEADHAVEQPQGDAPHAAGALRVTVPEAEPWLERLTERLPPVARLERMLEQAGRPAGLRSLLRQMALWAIVAGTATLLLSRSGALTFVATGAGAVLPYLRLVTHHRKRRARIEEQLPEAIDLISRAVRAGHPFAAGLNMAAEEMRSPIGDELRRVFEEQRFGMSVQESLLRLANRIDSLDVRMFVVAVVIQREVGGSLAEILEGIAEMVRERFRIQRQVRTYTAQGRMTGMLLALLPLCLGVLIYLVDAEYVEILFDEPLGRMMLGGAAFLQIVGYLIIRRITTIQL